MVTTARDDPIASLGRDKGELYWERGNYKPRASREEKACVPQPSITPQRGTAALLDTSLGLHF